MSSIPNPKSSAYSRYLTDAITTSMPPVFTCTFAAIFLTQSLILHLPELNIWLTRIGMTAGSVLLVFFTISLWRRLLDPEDATKTAIWICAVTHTFTVLSILGIFIPALAEPARVVNFFCDLTFFILIFLLPAIDKRKYEKRDRVERDLLARKR